MRNISSIVKEIEKLNRIHSEQFKSEKWSEMNTTQRKRINALNALRERGETDPEAIKAIDKISGTGRAS